MRLLRFICALALAVSLAASPVFAAVTMMQAAPQEMTMTGAGNDHACCDDDGATSSLMVCCHLAAVSVEPFAMPRPRAEQHFEKRRDVLVAFISRPDPPPPRSVLA